MARERVDDALVARGLVENIERARALVMAGRVFQGEIKVLKPSEPVRDGLRLCVRDEKKHPYVSRGGLKLKRALEAFQIDVSGVACIDVGASTGGFTDVMLRAGARRVYAIDVGYGQLDYRLRNDERVVVMERTNARFLTPEQFDEPIRFGATDVSFISLKAILPAALRVLSGERRFVALIKPQFEVPQEQVGPKGVVRDPMVHARVIEGIVSFVETIGWRAQGLEPSPIAGPEGNIEFLLDLRPADDADSLVDQSRIRTVTSQAYDNFMKSR